MRVVFMGTPALAATVLDALADTHEVVGVFTRPDAVRGRGKSLVPSSVKKLALEREIPVYTPESLKEDEAIQLVASLEPDVICVVAYGALLPPSILEIPRYGCLNVHTSILPRWRGAAPIERAILAHDEESGVCIMKMDEGLDTGAYCSCDRVAVGSLYVGELSSVLADMGAKALTKTLDRLQEGTVEWVEQNEDGATYASKISKNELAGEPADGADLFCAKVRASSNSHPCRIQIDGRSLAVERAEVVGIDSPFDVSGLAQGEATVTAKRLFIGLSDGVVQLTQVKPDGKKSMEGRAFAAGLKGVKGARVNWGRA